MELWSAPVRYGECDQQGIVFNAHYLAWADEAATAWFTAVGTPYGGLLARGLDARVRASTLEWAASARYGDLVTVDGQVERVGASSLVLILQVRTAERQCCAVRTTYVVVGHDGRPVRVPDDLRARWSG